MERLNLSSIYQSYSLPFDAIFTYYVLLALINIFNFYSRKFADFGGNWHEPEDVKFELPYNKKIGLAPETCC